MKHTKLLFKFQITSINRSDTVKYPIPTKLKDIRKKRGLTQTELADGICTQAMISNFEKGESIPTSTVLYELSKKLGIDINYFFEEDTHFNSSFLEEVNEVKNLIENLRQARDYPTLNYIVTNELDKFTDNKSSLNYQYLLWHKGLSDYYVNKDYNSAIEVLHNAYNLENHLDFDPNQQLSIVNSIAMIYFEEKMYEQALDWYEKNLYLMKYEQLAVEVKIKVYYGIARTYSYLKNYEFALFYAKKALNFCLSFKTLFLLGDVLFIIGRISLLQKNYSLSEDYLTASKAIFSLEDKDDYILVIDELLARTHNE